MSKNQVSSELERATREALRVLSALPAVSEREIYAASQALARALGE